MIMRLVYITFTVRVNFPNKVIANTMMLFIYPNSLILNGITFATYLTCNLLRMCYLFIIYQIIPPFSTLIYKPAIQLASSIISCLSIPQSLIRIVS